jgi:hypothetical protein
MPAFLNELSPNVVAALVGAGATLAAALINLRIAWRREVLDRLQRARTNPRSRRGLLIAVAILVAAAAVGGYAAALYVMQRDRAHTAAMRAELQSRIGEMRETVARLEQARREERAAIENETRQLEQRRRGAEGVVALARVGPCRARAGTGDAAEPVACGEADAVQASVCAPLPVGASVYEVTPFARFDGEGEARVALGERLPTARFAALPAERAESGAKRVCLDFWTWDSQRPLEARLLVKYLLPDAPAVQAAAPSQ